MSQRQDWTKWGLGSWLTSSISNREQQNSFKAPFHCAFCLFLALFVSVINPQYLLFSWYSCSLCIYNINFCIFILFVTLILSFPYPRYDTSLSKFSVRYPLFTNPRYDALFSQILGTIPKNCWLIWQIFYKQTWKMKNI